MLNCAVPGCDVHEKYLRSGSLHMVDLPVGEKAETRIVWFCRDCSGRYTVQTWRPAGEQIRLRVQASFKKPVAQPSDSTPLASPLRLLPSVAAPAAA